MGKRRGRDRLERGGHDDLGRRPWQGHSATAGHAGATHQRRHRGAPGIDYDFAAHGWLGHNGDIPGYATVVVYLPERDATLVVFVNSDIPEPHSAGQIAYDVTSIATPDHLYEVGPKPPELLREPRD